MSRQRVLIPLDGSAYSQQIIGQVQKFTPPEGYELTLLRVSEAPKGLTGHPSRMISADQLYPVFENERELEFARHPIYASQKMETAVAELTDELLPVRQMLESAGYAVSTAVRFGDPAHAIVAYAAGEGIDLIAMTTHGRTGLPRLIAGSVASYVIQHAQVPVLLFRPAALAVEQPESTVVLAAE